MRLASLQATSIENLHGWPMRRGVFWCMRSGKLAVFQERTRRGKIMSSARLSTEALESCLRRVICKGMKEGKPPASTARWLFAFAERAKV